MVGLELLLLASLQQACAPLDINRGTCATVIDGGVEIVVGRDTHVIGRPTDPPPPPYTLPDGTCNRAAYPLCRDVYAVTGPVRVVDIASFHAARGTATMSPDGWSLVGRPATVRGAATVHEVAGVLLTRPAVVRFTPTAFRWDFGDGTTGSSTPAAPAVEHVYRRSGAFTVSMTVEYSAQYRWAESSDWVPVIGTVVVPSAAMPVQVRSVTAVLVPGDCAADPAGPGC